VEKILPYNPFLCLFKEKKKKKIELTPYAHKFKFKNLQCFYSIIHPSFFKCSKIPFLKKQKQFEIVLFKKFKKKKKKDLEILMMANPRLSP
jgi:hypothetical protein